MAAPLTLLALLIELMVGYPDRLVQSIGHPVTWMGRLIAWLDRRLNREGDEAEARRRAGAVALLALLGVVGVVAFDRRAGLCCSCRSAWSLSPSSPARCSPSAACSCMSPAWPMRWRSGASTRAARRWRRSSGAIPTRSTRRASSRAAIESLAENFSDGVVAPAFWHGSSRGCPGAAALQGDQHRRQHDRPSHARATGDFGWAAARLDDLVNLPGLAALGAADRRRGRHDAKVLRPQRLGAATWRDGPQHRSPNAGYPEAAMAGALGLALAGPRVYDGDARSTARGWAMGGARRAPPTSARALDALPPAPTGLLIAIVAVLGALIALA